MIRENAKMVSALVDGFCRVRIERDCDDPSSFSNSGYRWYGRRIADRPLASRQQATDPPVAFFMLRVATPIGLATLFDNPESQTN